MSDASSFTNIIPSQIVHYSRGEPFRSLTSVGQEHIRQVIKGLNDQNTWGLSRFSDPDYLPQRFEAEERLRQRFIDNGGKPALRNPIYFFLGRHSGFENHESNIGYLIDLKDLDPYSISFTYGDSMFSFVQQNRAFAGSKYLNPLCADVYSLETLPQLFGHSSFPKSDPLHIEAHLWIQPNLETVKRLER